MKLHSQEKQRGGLSRALREQRAKLYIIRRCVLEALKASGDLINIWSKKLIVKLSVRLAHAVLSWDFSQKSPWHVVTLDCVVVVYLVSDMASLQEDTTYIYIYI
uniref:Uncharacterized protein n=1 Tax=Ananas comosus var. bracteatus TaxID=296719 RepID=A0A6V7PW50_ANACO|nr:unnamed protein product [Ananas comosus var. bracteatus]